ncbi:MAG: transporter [Bacteroidetes bacterium]|nr:transporter [Bacteroidota bacterium]
MKHVFMIILSLYIFHSAFSQDDNPPMVTDRPDRTESAVTVPKKTFQIESGFNFGWGKNEGVSTKELGFNGTLFRYGIADRFEARVGVAYAGVDKENEITEEKTSLSGFVPLVIGFKWNFIHGDGPIPTMALLSHIDLPFAASKDFDDGNVLHNIIFSGSWYLSKVFSFGFNFGSRIDWKQSDFTTVYTTALGISIAKWLGTFVELYGFLPAGEYSDHRFNMGFTFPVRNNLQFDVSGGMGISKNSPDGFASFGFAWRIPR